MNKKEFKKILVFQTAFLGDALLSIPLLRALRRQFPEAKIAFVCRKNLGELFRAAQVADDVIEVDKANSRSRTEAYKQSKIFSPDLILSPHQSFRTARWVKRLKVKYSVGFKNFWSFFAYDFQVARPNEEHDVLRQLSLMRAFGVDERKLSLAETSLQIGLPDSIAYADLQKAIVISPGSQWNTKRWTKEGFVEVGRSFAAQGQKVVVVGTKDEEHLCSQVSSLIPGAVNMAGQTSVLQLAQILKCARLAVCNDSGTMHVAVSVGTPVVSVFGPTVQTQGYAPWSQKARVVEISLACRPCGKHGHNTCPIGTHDCMKKVSAQMVLKAAKEVAP